MLPSLLLRFRSSLLLGLSDRRDSKVCFSGSILTLCACRFSISLRESARLRLSKVHCMGIGHMRNNGWFREQKLCEHGKSEMTKGSPEKRGCLTDRNNTVLVNRSKTISDREKVLWELSLTIKHYGGHTVLSIVSVKRYRGHVVLLSRIVRNHHHWTCINRF